MEDLRSSDNDTLNRKRKREDSTAHHCCKEFKRDEMHEQEYKDLNSSGSLNADSVTERYLSGEHLTKNILYLIGMLTQASKDQEELPEQAVSRKQNPKKHR
ncbi:hypothetical protein GWI33_010134 [Rhynchophorus ferrugineus]|uniref:Uncharacterized protein n=1 Tax=Rhynchophorus ferrugineus TaxID=354439 RepID=A0A834ME52_RHYFE|nr:hypothetical protein GWI33_010134 [Rhynchophorus ferrugineus]